MQSTSLMIKEVSKQAHPISFADLKKLTVHFSYKELSDLMTNLIEANILANGLYQPATRNAGSVKEKFIPFSFGISKLETANQFKSTTKDSSTIL